MKIRAGRCMTMSFDSKAYMTVGFQAEIPDEVKIILSQLIRKVASKDNKDIDYTKIFDFNHKKIVKLINFLKNI